MIKKEILNTSGTVVLALLTGLILNKLLTQEWTGFLFMLMLLILSLICLYPLIKILSSDNVSELKSPPVILGLMTFIFYVLGSIGLFLRPYSPQALISPSHIAYFPLGLLYVTLGYLSFLVGYHTSFRILEVPKTRGNYYYWDPSVAAKYLLILVVFIWWGRYEIFRWGFGVTRLATQSVWDLNFVQKSFLQLVTTVSFLIVPALAVVYYRSKGVHRRLSIVAAWLILLELIYNIIVGPRQRFVWNVFSFIIIRTFFKKRFSIRVVLILLLVFLVIVTPFVYAMRVQFNIIRPLQPYAGQVMVLKQSLIRAIPIFLNDWLTLIKDSFLLSVSTRLNPMQLFSAVIARHEGEDYPLLHGRTILYALPAFIPRIIWPSKPAIGGDDPEIMVLSHFGYPIFDTMLPPITELYANFGQIGIILGMALYGMFMAVVYKLLFHGKRSGDADIVAYIASLRMFLDVQTEIVLGAFVGIRWLLLMWLFCYLISKKSRASVAHVEQKIERRQVGHGISKVAF